MVEHGLRLALLNGLPVHVPAVSLRELTGTTALKPGIPAGGPERYTNTGHGVRSHRSVRCGSFLERRETGVGGSGAEQASKLTSMTASCLLQRRQCM